MQARTERPRSPREPQPPQIDVDDDTEPFEEWTLDEIDGDLGFAASRGLQGFDAHFD